MGQAALVAGAGWNAAAAAATAAPEIGERRIVELDGVRGAMTLLVLLSHLFGEVPNGLDALKVGWIAVDMFFVLSGFLIGRLILDKKHHANFFAVFYARRIFRLIPLYVLIVGGTALATAWADPSWAEADPAVPLWSYFTFTQTLFMVASGSIGAHWLAPTWTLAVEEHFYLVAPALLAFTPARWLPRVIAAGILGALSLRVAIYGFGFASPMVALVLLPGRADLLLCGIAAAMAQRAGAIPARADLALRVVPVAALVAVAALKLRSDDLFAIWNPLLLGIGCACFLLSIVRGAPEARRFRSPVLRLLGDTGYVVYLIHLPVIGVMHGLCLGSVPDIATPAQGAVSVAALAIVLAAGWVLTTYVEVPLSRYGRTWRWSGDTR